MSADMDADLSALLVSVGKDDNTEAMPGEDLLKELAQELAASEKTSPPLREGLAAIFNNLLSEKMGDEKLKAKLDKYPRPENVKGLRTPKVNPSIWSQLSTSMKTQDVRSQKGQNTLIGAISAMTKGADLALGKYSNDKELITLLTDAVAMALQYNHEVNHSRRLAMKREMHKDYAALCNPSTVDGTSEYLFGDLSKLAKDITEANLQGDTSAECHKNGIDTITLFTKLGFHIHPENSVFIPSQKLTFLGFVLDSIAMTVTLTEEKLQRILSVCASLLKTQMPTIRQVAEVIGILVSNFPGAQY